LFGVGKGFGSNAGAIPGADRSVLRSDEETVPVLPDSFLGGSAPRLQFLRFLSATHLGALHVSHSGYISPDTVITALSTLTNLQKLRSLLCFISNPLDLTLTWQSEACFPRHALSSPFSHFFSFKGVCEYLDDFVARIDTHRLNKLYITFFNDIVFDAPRFIQFINRTPTLKVFENADVVFEDRAAKVKFSSQTSDNRSLEVGISCREWDWQVSSLEQVCTTCLPPLSTTEDVYIYSAMYWQSNRQDNIENSLWLELLRSFTAVKNLYVSKEFAPLIVPALQELVASRTTESLPTLQNILLEGLQLSGPIQKVIGKFVAARQFSGHSPTVSLWDRSVIEEID
jgi:hypothetical protein